MGQPRNTGFHRTLLAFSAALIACSICVHQGHVRIDLADPASFASPFQHRCGQLMLACLAWAVCEVTLYFRPTLSSSFAEP